MIRGESVSDSDWGRAFLARLLACLGIVPLAASFWLLFVLVQMPGGAKETLVLLASLCSFAPHAAALALGHWPSLRGWARHGRWRMGIIGTLFLSIALCTSATLAVMSAVYLRLHLQI
jgi:hypothetical protein